VHSILFDDGVDSNFWRQYFLNSKVPDRREHATSRHVQLEKHVQQL
jgi:hypothetical protein